MSDTPVRSLAQQLSDPFARQLLESARADSPEPGARDRALLGLGLAPVGLLAVTPPAAAAAAANGPAGVVAVGSKAVPWVLAKSLAIGLVGSVVAISALDRALWSSPQPAAAPSPSAVGRVTPNNVSVDASNATVGAPTDAPTAVAESAPTLARINADKPPEAARIAMEAAASAASVARPSGGLLELEALARARRALSAHESGLALSLLDDFERRFPTSQVAEEAAVLRVETLRALGRTSEAHALGLRFLRERPFSVYAAKVSAMTGSSDRASNRSY